MRQDTKNFLKELFAGGYQASAIGLSLVIAIFLGAFFGYLRDNYFGAGYLFKIIGLIFGIIAGFRNVYLSGKKFQDKK